MKLIKQICIVTAILFFAITYLNAQDFTVTEVKNDQKEKEQKKEEKKSSSAKKLVRIDDNKRFFIGFDLLSILQYGPELNFEYTNTFFGIELRFAYPGLSLAHGLIQSENLNAGFTVGIAGKGYLHFSKRNKHLKYFHGGMSYSYTYLGNANYAYIDHYDYYYGWNGYYEYSYDHYGSYHTVMFEFGKMWVIKNFFIDLTLGLGMGILQDINDVDRKNKAIWFMPRLQLVVGGCF